MEDVPPLKKKKVVFRIASIVVFFLLVHLLFLAAPKTFPLNKIISIDQGAGLRSVSLKLKSERVIRSRIAFETFVMFYGGEGHIIATDYLFENREPVYIVARRIARGESNLAPMKITIPEGFNTEDIANIFASRLMNFNKEEFLFEARSKEGYLFPDTYFFLTTATEGDVIKALGENFEKKFAPLRPKIASLKKTEKDIIIMASLLEREAEGDTDREFISGILWKRVMLGMPLQVDAALETYKTKGLPKNPISNPGLKAINAAIYPKSSNYLYYLHDKDGVVHYAKNFAEHRANVEKYLK